jgi:hypothetical protein
MRRANLLMSAALPALMAGLACNDRNLATCDITLRTCQENIYYRMLNLRGDGYDPFGGLPPLTVISEDDFRAILEKDEAEAAKEGPSPWDKGKDLLHFTSSGSPQGGVDGGAGSDGGSIIDDEVKHIYAYYDPEIKTVTVISHPDQTGSNPLVEAMLTLAHELVHALQDREIDLMKSDFHTSDEYLAYDAIIEGDARFYEYLFVNELRRMLEKGPLDVTEMLDEDLKYVYDNFDQLGLPLSTAWYLLYPLGAKYEAAAYQAGGNAAVRHAYAKAPRRTVGLLVGADGRAPPVGSGDVCPAPAVTSLPMSGPTVGADQFGALLFYAFLRGWGVDHDVAFAAAQTWTGDFLLVQASSDYATTAVAWRIEFSAAPPAVIAQTLRASGELDVVTGANSLQITVTDSATPLTWKATANCP